MKTARYVEFKVFNVGHKTHETFRIWATGGMRFTEDGAKRAAENFLNELQARTPMKLSAIPLQFNRFNIVHQVGRA